MIRYRWPLCWLGYVLLLWPQLSHAQKTQSSSANSFWTLKGSATRAIAQAPELALKKAELQQALAQLNAQRVNFFPHLEMGARYTRLSPINNDPLVNSNTDFQAARDAATQVQDPAARAIFEAQIDQQEELAQARIRIPQNQYALYARLSYPITQIFLEILPAFNAHKQLARAKDLESDVAQRSLALQTAEAYFAVWQARYALRVAKRYVERARADQQRADALLTADLIAKPEHLRFQARYEEARAELTQANAQHRITQDILCTLLNIGECPKEIKLREPQRNSASVLSKSKASRAAMARSYQRHPQWQALQALLNAQKHQQQAKQGGMWPKLIAQAGVDYANPNTLYVPPGDRFRTSWDLSLLAQWSPDDSTRAYLATQAAKATRRATQAKKNQLERAIRTRITRHHALLQAAKHKAQARNKQRQAAGEAYQAKQEALAAGLAHSNELLASQLEWLQAERAFLAQRIEEQRQWIHLQDALGYRWWR